VRFRNYDTGQVSVGSALPPLTKRRISTMATKQIPLNKGAVTIVDEADYERLMKYKWRISEKGYAMRTQTDKGKASGVTMHRMLLDPPKGFMADHINGDRLDNRRCNLRVVNALQNAQNRKKNQNSRSMYKGVSWKVSNGKWQARIRVEKQQYHIGLYDTELEAAYAYNEAAKLQHGDYSRLNVLPDGYVPPQPHGDCPLCHQSLTKREMINPKKAVDSCED
jgi:hypothetical protein